MKFEWITSWDAIWSKEFVDKWDTWMEKSENSHVFFHPSMVKAWVDTYIGIRDIRPIFCIASQGDVTIFLPLVLWKKNWKSAFEKAIVPVGHSDFDYHSPVVIGNNIEKINWTDYWSGLYKEIDSQLNGKFDTFEIDGVKKTFNGDSKSWKLFDQCPYIDLKPYESYEDFLGVFKTKERSNVKRQIRRLEEIGVFKFEVLGDERKDEILAILPTLLKHHSLRWPKAYKAPSYHYNLIVNALEKNLLHFAQITIDGEAISWNISFVYKNTYYYYMSIYTEKYSRFSPGKLNMFLCIGDVINKNYEKFDLLRGAEGYKNKLPVENDAVFQYMVKNNTLSSSVKSTVLQLKKRINEKY